MYLKEIRSHGFKSFADKVKIELNKGITGIVGPNGSGKSNVVDAVRWVLGEQSVKSLRGDGNMTDVIFSGSKSRNPMSIASVTLVFDNSDHYLPLDYNEVSIKRRVYKDGTNEYFINNEKVRLKDITDILLDSGIAKESFNIISQGKIEEILSSKPSDRRIIFEEAAGVLKYKRRKEDALRKLDRTNDNVNRVDDIIKELEVQVEPLKDQKEKALAYLEIKDELENIEISLIGKDITNINNTYQENKIKIEELNQEILNLSSNNTMEEAKIEEYKLKLSKLDSEINTLQAKILDKTTEVERINSQKSIILERKKYEVEDAKLHTNLVNLKETELKLTNEVDSINRELTNKQTELDNISKVLKTKVEIINKLKDNKTTLESDLSYQVRSLKQNEDKVDYLKSSIENNSSLPNSVRSVLNNPKLNGIYDTIGNILEIDDKYKTAIGTSLGMSLNNVIVANEVSAKEAINYLKQNNIGRATFFPLNIIEPKTVNIDLNYDGLIGIASSLVHYDTKYDNIVKNQLGNVLVVDTIDNANIISRKLNYRFKIVTLDGELLHIGGSLTGGNNLKSRNIITEKLELETLINTNKQIISNISILEDKINSIDTEYKNLEDEIYLIEKDKIHLEQLIETKKINLNDLTYNLNSIVKEISGTNHLLNNTLSSEEENVINAYYSAQNELNELTDTCSKFQVKRQDTNDSLEEFEYSLKKENSLFNEKNKQLKELEISNNRFDVKLDNLLNTLNETYNMTYEHAISKYHLEIDEDIARNRLSVLKKQLKEIGVVNLGAVEEYERISVRYEFLLNQRNDLTNALNILLDIINEMDSVMEKEFLETFKIIEENFKQTFKELFKGGQAELKMTDPSNVLETGIEIIASPPGKKLTSITLLSGGEKTFTAISLLFAILKSRQVPFCILDEVEAALDEVNVDSFGKYLIGLKEKTQFILITHKKRTMEYVDNLYGITMQESGVSKLVSVKLEEL